MNTDDLQELRSARMRDSLFHGLLSGEELASLSNRNGLSHLSGDAIHMLWALGILRADYVSSDEPLEIDGLLPVQAGEHPVIYLDARRVEHRAGGYGSAGSDIAELHDGMRVYFHPFRLFVLYHVQRVFDISFVSTQFLLWQPGISTVAKRHEESMVHFTSGTVFGKRFNDWNVICEAAVVTEPMLNTRFVPGVQLHGEAFEIAKRISPWLKSLGQLEIQEMRGELGRAAHDMDSNKSVHVLMRLAQSQHRTNLKGRLAACLHFLKMAECVRRAAEVALEQFLPEEDEIGYGTWMQGARKMLYGTERVFDALPGGVREYMTILGLDHGTRVRCYVEGETEAGALARIVNGHAAFEIINLRGQFVQRNGKGLAFAASLEADYCAQVISIVVLDGDVGDNLRALRKTLREGRCFAPFFVSKPDFEQANFTADELEMLLREYRRQRAEDVYVNSKPKTVEAKPPRSPLVITDEESSQPLSYPKSEAWGQLLMEHALMHPDFPVGHSSQGNRPIVEVAKLLFRACKAGFQSSVDRCAVDETTGKIVLKAKS